MHILMPKVFYVPVRYDRENILGSQNRQNVIGVSLPNQREARWIRDKEGMEKEAQLKGIELKIVYCDFDPIKQGEQVEALINDGIDVLIIVPLDEEISKEMIEKAKKLGVKVISYDNILRNSDIDFYVAFNNERVGELQGRYIIEKVPRGNYIVLSGIPEGEEFKKGAMEYITPLVINRSIKIVEDKAIEGWNPEDAFRIVSDALSVNSNNINAILSPNDAIAGAAIMALENQGLAGIVAVTGQDADLDAVRRIVNGTQLMTVFKDSRELGKTAINVAISIAKDKPIDVSHYVNNGKSDIPSILIDSIAVDKKNIDKVLIAGGVYKKEDIYKRNYK